MMSPSNHREKRRRARGEGPTFNVIVETRMFAGGGTSAHDARIAELRPLPEAALSPDDAAELGVSTGDYVDLVLDRGSDVVRQAHHDTLNDLLVEARPGMPRGSIALIGGLPDGPANVFVADAIVSVTNIRRVSEEAAETIGASA
jgi:anaerobic selenocysteine-containing dehydrogenase